MNTPVLFLIFNRPDTTARVFETIRLARPKLLFIAADGPRGERRGEAEKCQQVKDIVANVDWPCDVKTLFRSENLGCGLAVSGAITWFFEHVDQGIILEDDCSPNRSFFNYCEELLDRYKDDPRIMHISGDQFVPDFDNGASYYFAQIQHCWGWATWADRWKYYNFQLDNCEQKDIEGLFTNKRVEQYWKEGLNRMKSSHLHTWDVQWAYTILKQKGLCINPSKNLVSNIGFGSGTHTRDKKNPYANMKTFDVHKIIHPQVVEMDQEAVDYIYKHHLGIKEGIFEKILSFWSKPHDK